MFRMANHAYASVWTRGSSEAPILGQFGLLVSTVPFSREQPVFTSFVVRAVEPGQAPLLDQDSRLQPVTAVEALALAGEYLHDDVAFEATAHWDLWAYGVGDAGWQLVPQPLLLACYAEQYDEGVFREMGNFHVDLGFEHLFTGHAGLLGMRRNAVAPPEHPIEAAFVRAMSDPRNLREYRDKTNENIRKLLDWMQRIATVLPVEKTVLWSEGEENFEARLEEILATR
jgi:hypothetical protein